MFRFRLVTAFVILTLLLALPVSALPPRGPKTQPKTGPPTRPGPSSMDTNSSARHSNANEEPKVDFRSETLLVRVPTVVVDKQGNPVSGLTKEDFDLAEDGQHRAISVCEEISSPKVRILRAPTTANTFTNGFSATQQPGGVTVFLLDTINTPFLDQAYGRKELIRYLASNLDPTQSLALVLLTSSGIKVLHDVTDDPAELIQALKKLNGELPAMQGVTAGAQIAAVAGSGTDPGPVLTRKVYQDLSDFVENGDGNIARLQQDRAIESTMNGFLGISWALSGIPGRKSLVWATGSLPFYIDSPGAVPNGYLAVLYERAMKALNDAQISIYPVDLRGLVTVNSGADYSGRGSRSTAQLVARSWLQGSTIDTLRDLADMTGGRAFYNTNDLAASFHRVAADSSHYYMLGYYLNTANRNAGWRSLKVKVHRNNVEVRSRNGFFVTHATTDPELSRKLDITYAANAPFNGTGVPISVQWTELSAAESKGGTGPDKKQVGFLLRIGGAGISTEAGQKNSLNMELAAVVFAAKGPDPDASISQTFAMAIPDSEIPKLHQQGLGYRSALQLTPGKYTVRFVVRDNLNGQIGSVSAPVTVN